MTRLLVLDAMRDAITCPACRAVVPLGHPGYCPACRKAVL
jgi:hypothetical protein